MKRTIQFLKKKALEARREILTISYFGRSAHISSCLSIIDILIVLYWEVMKVKSSNPNWDNRDRFILSKGHTVAALYVVLFQKKFMSKKTLYTYGKDGSDLIGHPEYTTPGVELSTGSLGHGLSVAIGMALAAKLENKKYRIFVLISDAECQEGAVWESLLFASHHKLNNLYIIVDYNNLQAFGKTSNVISLEPLLSKGKAFNFNTIQIDGHDLKKIANSFSSKNNKKPNLIIANTTGGKGISFMQNEISWHYHNLDEKLYNAAIKELVIS